MKPPSHPSALRRVALLGIGAIALGLALAYRPLALDIALQQLFRRPTAIQRIQEHQGRNLQGMTVSIQGNVSDRAPLVDAEVYELTQGDHGLWVLTSQPGVQTGDRLYVRGTLQAEAIEQNGVTTPEYYLREIRRRQQP